MRLCMLVFESLIVGCRLLLFIIFVNIYYVMFKIEKNMI